MGFSCGIVGLPNVGKSTLFNALTRGHAAASNYPFCTIEPNVGVVVVPDPRLEALAGLLPGAQVVATTMRFVDIAGLVEGSHRGEGLGNQFLSQIAEVQAIVHVVRCFEDERVAHVTGRVDPAHDIEIVNTELLLRDLEALTQAIRRLEKPAQTGEKEARAALEAYRALEGPVGHGRAVRTALPGLSQEVRERIGTLQLLTAKPVLYVANVGEKEAAGDGGPHFAQVQKIAAAEGAGAIAISALLEAEIAELESEQERSEYLEASGLKEPGLARLIRAGYELLKLVTFFTAVGGKEIHAWTVPAGTQALAAAGKVHSDMERGFIRAEVVSLTDFVASGGEHGAREQGKLRVEGKEYVVRDGDVIRFRFNV